MSIFNKILELTKRLYPTGRAWQLPENSSILKLHRALSLSEERAYSHVLGILDSILPDNENFTEDDASVWENRLRLVIGSEATFDERKAAIRRKLAFPNRQLPRQHFLFVQSQLRQAGFDVYVHENRQPDTPYEIGLNRNYATETPYILEFQGRLFIVQSVNNRVLVVDSNTLDTITIFDGGNSPLNNPRSISIFRNRIYITNSGTGQVSIYRLSDFVFINAIVGLSTNILNVHVDESGIYVTVFPDRELLKFDFDLNQVGVLTSTLWYDIRSDSDFLYASSLSANLIVVINKTTFTAVDTFVSNSPSAMTIDIPNMVLYVSGQSPNNVISAFDLNNRTFISSSGEISGLSAIASDLNALFSITETGNLNKLTKINSVTVNRIQYGVGRSLFDLVDTVNNNIEANKVFFSDARLYVLTTSVNRVIVRDKASLDVIGAFGVGGTGDGQFNNPRAIHVFENRIYVADTGNNRIQVFDTETFNHVAQITNVTNPLDLYVDAEGIFVGSSSILTKYNFAFEQDGSISLPASVISMTGSEIAIYVALDDTTASLYFIPKDLSVISFVMAVPGVSGIDFDFSATYLYVTAVNTISIYNATDFFNLVSTSDPFVEFLSDIAVGGNYIYITSFGSSEIRKLISIRGQTFDSSARFSTGFRLGGSSRFGQEDQIVASGVVANHVIQESDPYIPQEEIGLRSTFLIGGETFPDFAEVPAGREREFRDLILKLKPLQTYAYLLIDYVN